MTLPTLLRSSAAALLLTAAAIATLLIYPEPLYAHHAQSGHLHLYADRPFTPSNAEAVFQDVERRLAHAPLPDPHSTYRIFIANSPWRRRLAFLWNAGVGGVNYYPIAHSGFLRQADVDNDRLLRTDGQPVPARRPLAYYATHEIAHSLIGKRTGALANWRLETWIREGIADYIAFDGHADIDAL